MAGGTNYYIFAKRFEDKPSGTVTYRFGKVQTVTSLAAAYDGGDSVVFDAANRTILVTGAAAVFPGGFPVPIGNSIQQVRILYGTAAADEKMAMPNRTADGWRFDLEYDFNNINYLRFFVLVSGDAGKSVDMCADNMSLSAALKGVPYDNVRFISTGANVNLNTLTATTFNILNVKTTYAFDSTTGAYYVDGSLYGSPHSSFSSAFDSGTCSSIIGTDETVPAFYNIFTISYTNLKGVSLYARQVSCGDTEAYTLTAKDLPDIYTSGFAFDGWHYDEQFTSQALAGQTIGDNITIYAKWLPVKNVQERRLINAAETIIHRETSAASVRMDNGASAQDKVTALSHCVSQLEQSADNLSSQIVTLGQSADSLQEALNAALARIEALEEQPVIANDNYYLLRVVNAGDAASPEWQVQAQCELDDNDEPLIDEDDEVCVMRLHNLTRAQLRKINLGWAKVGYDEVKWLIDSGRNVICFYSGEGVLDGTAVIAKCLLYEMNTVSAAESNVIWFHFDEELFEDESGTQRKCFFLDAADEGEDYGLVNFYEDA